MLESMPADDEDETDAWQRCWDLTALAAQTDDAAIREETIRACVGLLEQIERGTYNPFLGIQAAWTLARLKYTPAAPLIRRLGEETNRIDGGADYEAALEYLQGRRTKAYAKDWERPVKQWLTPLWEMSEEWQDQQDATDSEEQEEDAASQHAHDLIERFLGSPLAAGLPNELAADASSIAHMLLEYARVYEGAAPEELDQGTLRAVLLDTFPRKITAERDFFEKVPPVVEAVLRWMASEGILPDGESLAEVVRGWADQIVAAATDPANWGPGKEFMMQALRAGVDTTNREALQQFMVDYNRRIQMVRAQQPPVQAPIPIVEDSARVGRNDPCPCGSGKKYKKCCGDPAKGQMTSV